MKQTNFLQLLEDEGAQIVELCAGRIADGREFHAFIQMTIPDRARYQRDIAKGGQLDLNTYGEILRTGWGREPDEAVCAFIMENCTDNLKLLETIGRDAAAMQDIIGRNSRNGRA